MTLPLLLVIVPIILRFAYPRLAIFDWVWRFDAWHRIRKYNKTMNISGFRQVTHGVRLGIFWGVFSLVLGIIPYLYCLFPAAYTWLEVEPVLRILDIPVVVRGMTWQRTIFIYFYYYLTGCLVVDSVAYWFWGKWAAPYEKRFVRGILNNRKLPDDFLTITQIAQDRVIVIYGSSAVPFSVWQEQEEVLEDATHTDILEFEHIRSGVIGIKFRPARVNQQHQPSVVVLSDGTIRRTSKDIKYIYFGWDKDKNWIKIGETVDLEARWSAHRGSNPGLIRIGHIIEGKITEKSLHAYFNQHKIPNTREWFNAEPVVEYIRDVLKPQGLYQEEFSLGAVIDNIVTSHHHDDRLVSS